MLAPSPEAYDSSYTPVPLSLSTDCPTLSPISSALRGGKSREVPAERLRDTVTTRRTGADGRSRYRPNITSMP